jgi:hypothetical protein
VRPLAYSRHHVEICRINDISVRIPVEHALRKFIITSTVIALFCLGGMCHARDLTVKPGKDNTYEVEGYRFGKAEFFGYVGYLKDSKKITGILMKKGEQASAEQKHVVFETAQTQQLAAFIDEGGQIKPLTEPPTPPLQALAGQ